MKSATSAFFSLVFGEGFQAGEKNDPR